MVAKPVELERAESHDEQGGGIWFELKQSFREWGADKAPLLAAALAYFALFSIAPLLLISIAIAGLFFGAEATQMRVESTIAEMLGQQGAEAITSMVEAASQKTGEGVLGLIGGIVALLLGASGVFAHLKEVLNAIWRVEAPESKGIMAKVRAKLLSVGMVLSVGFLLVVSLLAGAVISGLGSSLSEMVPLGAWFWQGVQLLVSLAVITLLFAAIYKFIPDADIEWKDVWIGAAFTSLLFVIGKFLIGLYLGRSAVASGYGAAGSVIIILLWLYYSSLIVLFGGEFTEVHARRRQGIRDRETRGARRR